MIVVDPGHWYLLDQIDDLPGARQQLVFVKREGEGYPGNEGHHSGVIIQEVLRALIERLEYVDKQVPCAETKDATHYLRRAFYELEARAWRRHQQGVTGVDAHKSEGAPPFATIKGIEVLAVGPDGHILTDGGLAAVPA